MRRFGPQCMCHNCSGCTVMLQWINQQLIRDCVKVRRLLQRTRLFNHCLNSSQFLYYKKTLTRNLPDHMKAVIPTMMHYVFWCPDGFRFQLQRVQLVLINHFQ